MSRYIAKYMNLEKLKRPIFWNGGSTSIDALFFRGKKDFAFRSGSPCSVHHAESEGFWDFAAGDNSASCSSLGLVHDRIYALLYCLV